MRFEPWYRELHPRLLAAMLLATGRLDDAADATDEALARALQHWDRVSTMRSPEGWTFTVAFNLVRRRGRRRTIEDRVLRRVHHRPDEPTMPPPAGEAWSVVAQLPPRQRQVVVLAYIADLPQAEIAETLGISRGTVASTLADARAALGALLADDDRPAPEAGRITGLGPEARP